MQSDEAPPASGDDVAPRADAPDWTLWGILAGALVLRVAAILAFPSIHHPDEDFQIFEQAHRWAFGYGIVPWEFVVGIRSPVLPLIFAAVFKLAAPVVGGPQGYLLVARLLLALSSLAAVAAVYRMGRRTSMTHALIGALVAATWFEIVYFADRPLTGAVATTVLLVVLSLASVPGGAFTPRRLVAIGFSLGLCLMLRVQLAPGLFIVALWVGRLHMRQRWLPMALGGLVPVAVFALADWAVWGGFFHSYFAAVQVNLVENVASRFGTAPVGAYARWLLEQWRFAFPLLWLLIAVRARGSAVWILTAIAIIAVHSAIPHKEYRFVYPAFACLIIVAAMGSADLLQKARARLPPPSYRALAAAAALAWVAVSAVLGFASPFAHNWFKRRGLIEASFALAKAPALCGVLFYDNRWFETGGYAYLHRHVPFYAFDHRDVPRLKLTDDASFNAVVLKRASVADFSGRFQVTHCFAVPGSQDVCVMRRPGACRPALAMNAFLAPNMDWPSATASPAWTPDPPGRVWSIEDANGPSRWTRRPGSNVFSVKGCVNALCGGGTLSIVRSGNRVMVMRPNPARQGEVIYLGVLSGAEVRGWYPHGVWIAKISD